MKENKQVKWMEDAVKQIKKSENADMTALKNFKINVITAMLKGALSVPEGGLKQVA